jgi:multidrug efflux pump subunit AcrB
MKFRMMFLNFGCFHRKVIHTLIEALSWLVVFLFGDWRSTIIPATVPVSLVGTLFSCNSSIFHLT